MTAAMSAEPEHASLLGFLIGYETIQRYSKLRTVLARDEENGRRPLVRAHLLIM